MNINMHFGNGFGPGGTTVLFQESSPYNLYYRSLQPADYDALKAIHRDLFPIDYEEVFFSKAVTGEDRVFSWAAVQSESGREHLVGFVTARLVYLYECDPVDRQVMGMAAKALDGHSGVYVLTLGVVASCRQCGIARNLLRLVHQHAVRLRCRAIFLHVISYNNAAMRLYGSSGYQAMARLPNFYHLVTGRQPNPDKSWYDAFLYAAFLPSSGQEPSPALQWAGGMLGAAVAPFRTVLGTFNGCMPSWLCRQTYSTFLPFAGSLPVRTPSKGSLADTATSPWQQPLQLVPPASPYPQQQQHPLQQQQQQVPPSEQQTRHYNNAYPTGASFAGSSAEAFLQQQPRQPHERVMDGYAPDRGTYDWPGSSRGTSATSGIQQPPPPTPGGVGPDPSTAYGGSTSYASKSYGYDGAVSSNGMSTYMDTPVPLSGGVPGQLQQGQGSSPLLRPPSPLVSPGHSPSLSSLQQRHPHGGSASGLSTPQYLPPGATSSTQQQNGYHHQHHHHQHSHYNGQHGPGIHHTSGASSSSSVGNQGTPTALPGRTADQHRGPVQRTPHGLGGGGLQQQQQQPYRQQQSGSLLASLLRPPSAHVQLHSR